MRLNNTFIKVTIIIILFLDLLALDDITTGNETSLKGEYMVLISSALALVSIYYKRDLWIIRK